MMKRGHGQINQLHDINLGAQDASMYVHSCKVMRGHND